MKLQHLAIIFVIIILPMSMVLSYYTGSQIKTINLQKTYQSKLLTATYDAVKSFQLNTINNVYSSLSDSKIRDIEASISSFYDSLGSELGTTRYNGDNELSDFIPAILYTLYDGYYIYGKYYNEGIKKDDENYGDYTYGLKPYVYYSKSYKGKNYDFVVNYTLDNYITIYGNIPKDDGTIGYITKSGFLIDPDKITDPVPGEYSYTDLNGTNHENIEYIKSIKYSGIEIKPEILKENIYIKATNSVEAYEYAMIDNRKVYKEPEKNAEGENVYFWYDKNEKIQIKDKKTRAFADALCFEDHLYSNSACEYFYNAKTFSTFVNDKIGKILDLNLFKIGRN